MKIELQMSLFVVILGFAAAYWIDSDLYPLSDVDDIEYSGGLGTLSAAKRRKTVCMQWGMVCVPGSSFRFTKCCDGLNCVCNLWKSRCKCRAKLG